MDMNEFKKVKDMDYEEYCDYLQEKYGTPDAPYFTKGWSKNQKITRTKEGLVIHHKREDVVSMLSHPVIAKDNPYEYQLPEELVYCDYLEHLLLHVMCSDHNTGVGIGGVVNFIAPALNDYYSGWVPKREWEQRLFEKVQNDRDVYFEIMKKFFYEQDYPAVLVDMTKSAGTSYGHWDPENNFQTNKEMIKYIFPADEALDQFFELFENRKPGDFYQKINMQSDILNRYADKGLMDPVKIDTLCVYSLPYLHGMYERYTALDDQGQEICWLSFEYDPTVILWRENDEPVDISYPDFDAFLKDYPQAINGHSLGCFGNSRYFYGGIYGNL